MKHSATLLSIFFLSIILSMSCKPAIKQAQGGYVATISPIKFIVEQITCGDIPVEVILPDGASPETYSPTSSQMMKVESADIVFTTGLIDFEKEIINRVNAHTNSAICDLSAGIALHEGGCSHDHHSPDASAQAHSHHHGIDPHIWTSPKQLMIMAGNAYRAIIEQFPDSTKYTTAYNKLIDGLSEVSVDIEKQLDTSDIKYFIIYHPALTYYADDYGIEQVALEVDGKEPSATYMASLAKRAKEDNVKYVLYQRQFPVAVVETFAADIDAEPVEIDPLGENIVEEILRITEIITSK